MRTASAVTILLAVVLALLPPPQGFLAEAYAGHFYPAVQHGFTGWTNRLPFAAGDVLIVGVVAGVVAMWWIRLRRAARWSTAGDLLLQTAAVAAFLYIWFLVAWGWNYDRPSLAQTLGYRAPSFDRASLIHVESAMVDALNAAAGPAHAEYDRNTDVAPALATAERGTLAPIGVTHTVTRTDPKHTILDAYFDAAGISGMFFPFTYETFLASDLLWFERPFTLEHEWSHAAGIARESDANFVASLATLDSEDAILHYSGLLMIYAAMPRFHESDNRLSKLVQSDYDAMRRRNARRIKPLAFHFAWGTYNQYLKAQHVASGVINYQEYIRLLLGTPLGRETLRNAGIQITAR